MQIAGLFIFHAFANLSSLRSGGRCADRVAYRRKYCIGLAIMVFR